jgi:hypothetical protein
MSGENFKPSFLRPIEKLIDDAGFVLQSLRMAQKKETRAVRLRLSSAERKAMKKVMAKVRAAKKRKNRG